MRKFRKKYLKIISWRSFVAMFVLIVAATLHSCHKDANLSQQQINAEVAATKFPVNDAISWFNDHKASLATKVKINSDGAFLNNIADFTPAWDSARTAVDTNYYVVEAPAIYVKKMGFATDSSRANINGITRLLVLKSKKYGNLSAVLMQIHGAPGINIDNAHYMNLPLNFSGNIFYTTIQGAFINGYIYQAGKITKVSSSVSSGVKPTGPQILETAGPEDCSYLIIDWYTRQCDDYGFCSEWQYSYTDMYTYCEPSTSQTGGGGGGVTPPVCPSTDDNTGTYSISSINGKLVIRIVDPGDGGDGGNGDNNTGDSNACTPPPESEIAANPVKPCALKFKNITSNYMAVAVTGYKIGITDNVFGTKFITFNVQIGMPNYVSVQQAQNASAAAMLVAEATIAQTHGVDFFLNPGAQVIYSREFARLVQAELLSTLTVGVQVQNAISPGVPIITYLDNNCNP